MTADDRRIIEELDWHCDHPAKVAKLLTAEERAEILKKGFVPKPLWLALQPRIEKMEAE